MMSGLRLRLQTSVLNALSASPLNSESAEFRVVELYEGLGEMVEEMIEEQLAGD